MAEEAATKPAKKPKKMEQTVGKRKVAVARAAFRPGKGDVYVDAVPLGLWGTDMARARISEPLLLAGDAAKTVDIRVHVEGSGLPSQADAIRQAIARGLAQQNKELKGLFLQYDRNMLVFDPRRNEPHHGHGASQRGSRRHKQRSKR